MNISSPSRLWAIALLLMVINWVKSSYFLMHGLTASSLQLFDCFFLLAEANDLPVIRITLLEHVAEFVSHLWICSYELDEVQRSQVVFLSVHLRPSLVVFFFYDAGVIQRVPRIAEIGTPVVH